MNAWIPVAPIPIAWLGRGAPRRAAGFTLVEILMAIALSTLILGAAAVFIFSSFTLLTNAQNNPGLEHHKLGVGGFLQYAFSQSLPDSAIPTNPNSGNTTDPAAGNTTGGTTSSVTSGLGAIGGSNTTTSKSGATLAQTSSSLTLNGADPTSQTGGATGTSGNTSGNTSAGAAGASGNTTGAGSSNEPVSPNKTSNVVWGWPPGVTPGEDPYLSFVLPSDNPILVWEEGPRPPVRCFLEFKENEGLELIWVPPVSPNNIEMNAVRRTMLSPLVTKMTYVYYNPNNKDWDTSDTPTKDPSTGGFFLPDFVRLTFDLDGKVSDLTVQLPPAQTSVPLY